MLVAGPFATGRRMRLDVRCGVIRDRPIQRQDQPMSVVAPIGDKTLRRQFVHDVP